MDTKWTPGPWHVRYGDQIFAAEDRNLADVWTEFAEVTRAESKANAHLIAAAPDMAPLIEILAALPIGPNTADDVPLYGLDGVYITHGHVRAARAALAKARGEA